MMFFALLAIIGICFNVWLYIDDLKNRKGILDAVDKGDNLEDLMSTPVAADRRKAAEKAMALEDGDAEVQMNVDDDDLKNQLQVYKQDKDARDSLRRSVGREAMKTQH